MMVMGLLGYANNVEEKKQQVARRRDWKKRRIDSLFVK
jgi:hypothetical protein